MRKIYGSVRDSIRMLRLKRWRYDTVTSEKELEKLYGILHYANIRNRDERKNNRFKRRKSDL